MSRAATALSILKRYALTSGGAGLITALGRTLIEHFEAGGTLADFDVKHLNQAVRHLLGSTAPSTP